MYISLYSDRKPSHIADIISHDQYCRKICEYRISGNIHWFHTLCKSYGGSRPDGSWQNAFLFLFGWRHCHRSDAVPYMARWYCHTRNVVRFYHDTAAHGSFSSLDRRSGTAYMVLAYISLYAVPIEAGRAAAPGQVQN